MAKELEKKNAQVMKVIDNIMRTDVVEENQTKTNGVNHPKHRPITAKRR